MLVLLKCCWKDVNCKLSINIRRLEVYDVKDNIGEKGEEARGEVKGWGGTGCLHFLNSFPICGMLVSLMSIVVRVGNRSQVKSRDKPRTVYKKEMSIENYQSITNNTNSTVYGKKLDTVTSFKYTWSKKK